MRGRYQLAKAPATVPGPPSGQWHMQYMRPNMLPVIAEHLLHDSLHFRISCVPLVCRNVSHAARHEGDLALECHEIGVKRKCERVSLHVHPGMRLPVPASILGFERGGVFGIIEALH